MYIYVYTRINTVESAEFPIEIFLALANEGSLAICREFILSSLPRSLVCRVFEIIPPPRGRSERTDGGKRKRTNRRSFPMKIRRGRSGKLFFPSLPLPSRVELLFYNCVYTRGRGEERIFLFPQRRPKVGTKFKLAARPRLHSVIANTREITLISFELPRCW